MAKNVAKGSNRVAVQVGNVKVGESKGKRPVPTEPSTDTEVHNVREGNATVGEQADEIRGGISFRF